MIKDIDVNYEKMHDLYLRDLCVGKRQGSPTGKLSQDKPWLKYYSENQIMNFEVPKITIYEYMMKNNKNCLFDDALFYFGKSFSYGELDNLVNKFASSVLENGIVAGDIVTVCMPNTPEAVIAFYALNKIGVIANMIHPLSGENEIKEFLNESNSKLLLTIDSSVEKVSNIIDDTSVEKTIVVSPSDSMPILTKIGYTLKFGKTKLPSDNKFVSWNSFIKEGRKNNNMGCPFKENNPAVMLHTGGTTGKSKAVVLTNENFNSMVEQFKNNTSNFERGEKMLTVMPVFHGFGLCSSLHLPLSLGVGCILIPKLEVKDIDKIFDKYHPNHILGVPTLFKGILKNENMNNKDLSYVKNIVSGGDLVKDSLEDTINEFFRNHNANVKLSKGYGLSEAVAGATFATGEYNSYGSVGIPMIGTDLKIVKPGTDYEISTEEIGEICIKGTSVMKEYYNNEEETKNTLIDGWLHTGDLGCYSKNKNELYFSTRKGNMIISSGVNVYPNVIEEVIESHEAVAMCAVIGVKDAYSGEIPKAFVVLNEGYDLNQELEDSIQDLCKRNLNKYSVPKKYEYLEKLPQTLLGKVSHKDLRGYEQGNVLLKVRK